ncbi:hypothetical protein APS_2426 [Acetobacter pasteurianus subsp. pasteurianus LMG 1262 = NBRC 106471]|nr:hypothetical protein APS_2426 [Acetobacter pasteurianus subsp. pasteurianus LMG 1262 = NBRC 106471]CCT58438.1 hypothetical protein APA386B_319 [Acetobacter pasteurianus 386B]
MSRYLPPFLATADTKSFFTAALLRNTRPACQKAGRASIFCRAASRSIA